MKQVNLFIYLLHCICCITELKPPHKIAKLKLCISGLSKENYQTLKLLFAHLKKYVHVHHFCISCCVLYVAIIPL